MSKSVELELTQLKTAVTYFIGLLEEGSLVERYDRETREEIALVLQLLLEKVEDLPADIPEHLVQAAVVRSIIGASERFSDVEEAEQQEYLARQMREIDAAASIQGHTLSEWERVTGATSEFQATCKECGGFVYISHANTFNLLPDGCVRAQQQKRS